MKRGVFGRLCAAAGLIVSALLLWPLAASAQSYPTRVVKIIVPQTPGGATDVFARAIGKALSERWGQPVVVENRAGAAGNVGTDAVAKSAPDGYTLLVTYAGSQAINPALYANMPYDSVKDFQTVATIASTPFFLITHPSVPAKDLKELLALSQSRPEGISLASSGNGSVNHLLAEMLKAETGFRFLHVPYRGVAQAITDVIGGQVQSAFASVPSVLQNVAAGQVRAIAVSSAKRIAAAPDVPSVAESGYPNYEVSPWWGVLAPAGLDAAIVRKINADIREILATDEMKAVLAKSGAEPLVTTPEQFLAILKGDVEKWAKVVKAAGVKIQ